MVGLEDAAGAPVAAAVVGAAGAPPPAAPPSTESCGCRNALPPETLAAVEEKASAEVSLMESRDLLRR